MYNYSGYHSYCLVLDYKNILKKKKIEQLYSIYTFF